MICKKITDGFTAIEWIQIESTRAKSHCFVKWTNSNKRKKTKAFLNLSKSKNVIKILCSLKGNKYISRSKRSNNIFYYYAFSLFFCKLKKLRGRIQSASWHCSSKVKRIKEIGIYVHTTMFKCMSNTNKSFKENRHKECTHVKQNETMPQLKLKIEVCIWTKGQCEHAVTRTSLRTFLLVWVLWIFYEDSIFKR